MFNEHNTTSRLLGELGAPKARYPKSAKVFEEAEPADYIYQVVEGAVRSTS